MTRIVGTHNRSEFILDPTEALRLGRVLDAMLSSARLPRQHGVIRATHREMNRLDDQHQLRVARWLNPNT